MSLNTLNLKQKQGGRVIKQADRSSTFKFALQDSNGALINLNGQTANISLHNPNSKRFWETTAKVKGFEVEFKLPGNLTEDDYILEISCNGYVFPSDNAFIIEVVKGYKDLPDLKTAERYKRTIEEITQDYVDQSDKKLKDNLNSIDNTKKQVDESIAKGLKDIKDSGDTYINNIKTTFDTAKTEFDKNASVKTGLIDSKGNEYISLIGTKKEEAIKKIDGQVKATTDKYIGEIENKSKEGIAKLESRKNELTQGLVDSKKEFESNINNALTQAIKDIPYEKLKGDKGDRGEKGEAPLVFSSNPPGDKKTLWIKNDNVRNIYEKYEFQPDIAMYAGAIKPLFELENSYYNICFEIPRESKLKLDELEYLFYLDKEVKILQKIQKENYYFLKISDSDLLSLVEKCKHNEDSNEVGKFYVIYPNYTGITVNKISYGKLINREKYLTLNVYNPSSNKWEKI